MTREEAIEYLYKLFMQAEITDEYGDMDDSEPYETAIDMAIKALSDDSAKKDMLIGMLRHSSQYNTPCPEWVYDVIRHS